MRRSLVVSVVAAATALVAAPSAPAAPLTPTPPVVPAGVERMLAGVPDGETVPVLVRLRENGPGPSALAAGGSEESRRTALVRGLRTAPAPASAASSPRSTGWPGAARSAPAPRCG